MHRRDFERNIEGGVGGFLTRLRETSRIVFAEPNMSIRSDIAALFAEVAQEQKKTLAPLSDDLGLLETGLDSLCFAIIVARLEDQLGVDPFSADEEIDFPVTVGDFIKLYEHASVGRAA
jgi:acyl carrier protein